MENEIIPVDVQISLGNITSNIKEVREVALGLKNKYSNMIFDEDSIALAKEEKAKVNKLKDSISTYRKQTITEFKKPIEEFEKLSKETESILTETYQTINNQVQNYENAIINSKTQELKDYFNEYSISLGIDFVSFETANIKVTKTASMKSLKDQIKNFLDRISSDIETINMQENKTEILVEYKEYLNLGKAITIVQERKKRIEAENQKQEKAEEKKQEQQINYVEKPTEEKIEEKFEMTFTAIGTREQLKQLKEFAIKNNIVLKGDK